MLLLTMPATAAKKALERSFAKLKLIKKPPSQWAYTTSQERLSDLAVLSIETSVLRKAQKRKFDVDFGIDYTTEHYSLYLSLIHI